MVATTRAPAPLEEHARTLERLAPLDPETFLRTALEHLPGRVALGTAFGREGCALVHVVASAALPIDVFTLDTGLFFPETYALWRALEERYGIEIRAHRAKETPEEQAERLGPALWERQPNRCCHLRKVLPLREALNGAVGWVTGLRRDQSPLRRNATVASVDAQHGALKLNPLVDWSDAELDAFIAQHEIPTNPLHARGYPSIGCWPCTSAVSPGEASRAGRWRGRAKTECGIHADFAAKEQSQ